MDFFSLKTIKLSAKNNSGQVVDTIAPKVVDISGQGFELSAETTEGSVVDQIVSFGIKRADVTLSIVFEDDVDKSARRQEADFRNWLNSYSDLDAYRLELSLQDGGADPDGKAASRTLRLTCITKKLSLSSLTAGTVEDSLTLTPLSPWYVRRLQTMTLTSTAAPKNVKMYAYSFPYVYPGSAVSGSDIIENDFFKPVPVAVTLTCTSGQIKGPITMALTSADGGEAAAYSSVTINSSFSSGSSLRLDGETLSAVISPSGQDVFGDIDQKGKSFLYASQGRSRLSVSTGDEAGTAGQWTAVVEWNDYIL